MFQEHTTTRPTHGTSLNPMNANIPFSSKSPPPLVPNAKKNVGEDRIQLTPCIPATEPKQILNENNTGSSDINPLRTSKATRENGKKSGTKETIAFFVKHR